jgi:hypothetical protein
LIEFEELLILNNAKEKNTLWKKKKREVFWNKLCALVTQIRNNVDTPTPRSLRDDEKVSTLNCLLFAFIVRARL